LKEAVTIKIDEQSRHKLFDKLEKVLGIQDASALMEYLPPVGWADVATKRDLEPLVTKLEFHTEITALRSEMKVEMKAEIGGLRSDMASQFRTTLFTMMSLFVTLAALAFAAARLG